MHGSEGDQFISFSFKRQFVLKKSFRDKNICYHVLKKQHTTKISQNVLKVIILLILYSLLERNEQKMCPKVTTDFRIQTHFSTVRLHPYCNYAFKWLLFEKVKVAFKLKVKLQRLTIFRFHMKGEEGKNWVTLLVDGGVFADFFLLR